MRILWAVFALVVVAGVGYFLFNGPVPLNSHSSIGLANLGSLGELLVSGRSVVCKITRETNDETLSGLVYIGAGKMRIDLNVNTANGTKDETHLLYDGEFVYTWHDFSHVGFKVQTPNLFDSARSVMGKKISSSGRVSSEDNLSRVCEPWSLDEKLLSLPAEVIFEEPETLITDKDSTGAADLR
jgi:hypothetical protein